MRHGDGSQIVLNRLIYDVNRRTTGPEDCWGKEGPTGLLAAGAAHLAVDGREECFCLTGVPSKRAAVSNSFRIAG